MSNSSFLLALETSGRTASVALLEPSTVITERRLTATERTAQALIPMVREVLRDCSVTPDQLMGIAVAQGPGSFTGLRIGVTAAKTLAFALGCDLVGVNTLDVLAHQAARLPRSGRLWAVLDAQRSELFTACYPTGDVAAEDVDAEIGRSDRTRLMPVESWLKELASGDLVVGPVVARHAGRLPAGVAAAHDESCHPMAGTVGLLGMRLLKEGRASSPFQLVPQYHRMSAAEEKAKSTPPT